MYEIKTRIGYSKLNTKGQLSFRALLDLYQDCATFHSEDELCPLDEMIRRKNAWFLVSYQMKNYRMPRHGEYVYVRTYPIKIRGMMGIRTFELVNTEGKILAEAYSEWVFMDLGGMKPTRAREDILAAFSPDEVDLSKWGARKIAIPNEKETIGSLTVDGVFLDTNGHMNNAFYPDIALQAIGNGEYSDIKVEFKASAVKGDEIKILIAKAQDRKVVVLEGTNGTVYSVSEFSGEIDDK